MRGIHRGLPNTDDPHRGIARPHVARTDVAVVGRHGLDTRTGDFERVVGHDPETVGLDQSVRFDDQKPAIRGSAGYPHDPVGLIVGFQRPTEELVNLHPLFYDVETVFEVVEHLALGRQVRAILPESPLDVPGGEHGVRLVQPHVRVRVDPHAADARSSIDQDDLLVA